MTRSASVPTRGVEKGAVGCGNVLSCTGLSVGVGIAVCDGADGMLDGVDVGVGAGADGTLTGVGVGRGAGWATGVFSTDDTGAANSKGSTDLRKQRISILRMQV